MSLYILRRRIINKWEGSFLRFWWSLWTGNRLTRRSACTGQEHINATKENFAVNGGEYHEFGVR
jgi:hypothetical protein